MRGSRGEYFPNGMSSRNSVLFPFSNEENQNHKIVKLIRTIFMRDEFNQILTD